MFIKQVSSIIGKWLQRPCWRHFSPSERSISLFIQAKALCSRNAIICLSRYSKNQGLGHAASNRASAAESNNKNSYSVERTPPSDAALKCDLAVRTKQCFFFIPATDRQQAAPRAALAGDDS